MNNSFTPAEFQNRIKKQLGFGLQDATTRDERDETGNVQAETGEPIGFQEWLDAKGDAMAAPDSFETWLKEREDSI